MLGKHHTQKTRKKISDHLVGRYVGESHPFFGKQQTRESRVKMSESHKGVPLSREHIENRTKSRVRNGYRHSEDTLRKIGTGNKGKAMTAEARLKCAEANKGKRYSPGTEFAKGCVPWIKGRNHSEKTKEQLSVTHKQLFLNPDYIKKMAKAWNVKPNKPETLILRLLNDLFPGQWKYTGDFSFMINGKNPDFVNCNGQKKIIELFGDYWHRGQDPRDRAAAFTPFGYKTLVIWEKELKDMGAVISKINNFAEVA